MTRKNLIIAATITILLGVVIAGLLVLFRHDRQVSTTQLAQVPVFTTTPTPTENPKEKVGKFIIIPNGAQLTDGEIQTLRESGAKTVFLDNPSQDYATSLGNRLTGLVVQSIGSNSQYPFCNNESQAVNSTPANASSIIPTSIGFIDCSVSNKIANISKTDCSIEKSDCQKQYLISLPSDTYYYNTKTPLLALNAAPLVQVDSPYGTTIIDWTSNTAPLLSQNSYSVEILNQQNKRIYATGKVSGQNRGEYFSPTVALEPQQLTVKLRLWLQYKSIKFQSPLIVTSSLDYNKSTNYVTTSTTKVKQMSWIPDWGMTEGIASVQANPDKWDTISPVWFTPNKNGTLNKEPTLNNTKLLSLLRANNVKIIPTISTFDADILKEILNKNQAKHISEIVKMVVNNHFDGVDLDYESTYENDKALFLQFVTELASQLHAQGKVLSFTALAKIDDRAIYGFLPQTHQVQDWKAIGAVVDEFRIMAYDFTSQGSLQPGPLSPYDWNETLIRYAIAQMPASKVVLALPLYAHGWPKPKSTNLAGSNNDKSLSSGKLANSISPSHDNIAYIKSHSTYYRSKYDTVTKEVRAEFKYNGVERVLYYLDKTAVNERIQLAQKYGIKGICYWRIGGEKL